MRTRDDLGVADSRGQRDAEVLSGWDKCPVSPTAAVESLPSRPIRRSHLKHGKNNLPPRH
jgi:hypothetical protein